ncbi:YlxR family protein [Arthrobacter burdickii]|uniref:YlxR family protein n=1 Tax=Arthrobacter burdickii TaxID=3035920 RepID=A0ABT8K5J4_9MICC|nr:YlxR family protein [Arthrobacter burdickii]MDN4612730.1 YlxR family protein [Arthrobacter burdickii]
MDTTDVGSRPEDSAHREDTAHREESGHQPEDTHPIRTCVGCRRRDRQSHVMRVVARPIDGQDVAVIDERRRLSGRGAWLHPDPACMETAVKRKAFHRAFRRPVDTAQLAADFQAHLERRDERSDSPPSSRKAGQYPHGNPMRTQR